MDSLLLPAAHQGTPLVSGLYDVGTGPPAWSSVLGKQPGCKQSQASLGEDGGGGRGGGMKKVVRAALGWHQANAAFCRRPGPWHPPPHLLVLTPGCKPAAPGTKSHLEGE